MQWLLNQQLMHVIQIKKELGDPYFCLTILTYSVTRTLTLKLSIPRPFETRKFGVVETETL